MNRSFFTKISIIFLSAALFISIFITDWNKVFSILTFTCTALGAIVSILSLYIPNDYIFKFEKSDWIIEEDGLSKKIQISSKKHGLGKSPKAELFFKTSNGDYQSILTTPQVDSKGNITITIQCQEQEGKVVIK